MKFFKINIALITLICILATSFSPLFARKANAQWVVFDPANFGNTLFQSVKEVADGLARAVGGVVIERLVGSTINWINSGFRGSPAFVTNPQRYFQNVGDQIAGQYVFSHPNLQLLCGPLQQKIKIALVRNYAQEGENFRCTITDVIDNVDSFVNDFNQGGWEAFLEISQRQQNNPLGAYILAEGDLIQTVNSEKDRKAQELNWGKGFFSLKTCKRWVTKAPDTILGTDIGGEIDPETGIPIDVDRSVNPPPSADKVCVEYQTETPGDVLSNQLNAVLPKGLESLVAADEINEIVGALLSQLVERAIGGLRSLSRPSSSGGPSVTDQFNSSTPADSLSERDYFGQTINVELLDVLGSSNNPACNPNSAEFNPSNPECRRTAAGAAGINENDLVYPPTQNTPRPTPIDPDCHDGTTTPIDWENMALERGIDIINLDCAPEGNVP